MSGTYLGDFAEDAIVHFAFTTNAADGGRESTSASLEEADIVIYSSDGDGTYTAMTLDASTIIITENPGSQVGVYLIAVNMGNDADFTTGKDYIAVFYPDETVDSQSIAAVLAHWSCENRGVNVARIGGSDVELSSDNRLTVDVGEWNDIPLTTTNPLPNAAADAAGGLPISDAGGLDLDNRMLSSSAVTNANTVFDTDFATNYNATRNAWATNVQDFVGTTASDPFSGQVVAASVTGSVGSVTGNVGGNITGSVGSVLGGINTSGGAITTLDALDTAQDTQHATTQAAITTLDDAIIATTGAVSDLSPAANSFDTDLTDADNFWNDALLQFTSGSLNGQSSPIKTFANTGGTCDFDEAFSSAPSNGDTFRILVSHIHPVSQISQGVRDVNNSSPAANSLGADIAAMAGADGATLATAQGNYAPAVAGDQMDLVDAPNATAIGAVTAAMLAAGDVDGYTLEETLKLCLAALAGKLSGAATTTITIRAADDSTDRIVATVDADGNRSAVVLDETG